MNQSPVTEYYINGYVFRTSCFLEQPLSCTLKIERGGSMSQVVGLPNNSYKPITNTVWVRARFCKLQNGCTRLAAASDKVYQLLTNGRWFSPGCPASCTTKAGRHDIAEILLKVALNTKTKSSQNRKIAKLSNLKVFDSNKTKLKQDSQNRHR